MTAAALRSIPVLLGASTLLPLPESLPLFPRPLSLSPLTPSAALGKRELRTVEEEEEDNEGIDEEVYEEEDEDDVDEEEEEDNEGIEEEEEEAKGEREEGGVITVSASFVDSRWWGVGMGASSTHLSSSLSRSSR